MQLDNLIPFQDAASHVLVQQLEAFFKTLPIGSLITCLDHAVPFAWPQLPDMFRQYFEDEVLNLLPLAPLKDALSQLPSCQASSSAQEQLSHWCSVATIADNTRGQSVRKALITLVAERFEKERGRLRAHETLVWPAYESSPVDYLIESARREEAFFRDFYEYTLPLVDSAKKDEWRSLVRDIMKKRFGEVRGEALANDVEWRQYGRGVA